MTRGELRAIALARRLVGIHARPSRRDPDAHNARFESVAMELANRVIANGEAAARPPRRKVHGTAKFSRITIEREGDR